MRTWWVNQNQTFRQEQAGGYLWSPKRKANQHRNHYYDTMRVVAPGDLVLSFQGAHIRAVGVATSYCYESPKPTEFGNTGQYWDRIGWRVDVAWTALRSAFKPADHMHALRRVLPARYSPLQANGYGSQSVYLTEIPRPMMEVMASLAGYELQQLLQAAPIPLPSRVADHPVEVEQLRKEWEDHIQSRIQGDPALRRTERIALVRSRCGQGMFRDRVSRVEKSCRITRVDNPTHLIASHILPWRHANNEQRLDGENGLMLTPSVDDLFDRGFISFQDNGRLLISSVADRQSLDRMGFETSRSVSVGAFSEGQRRFLAYHRDDIFLESA